MCNPLYTLNNQGVFHCSDVAIMQSITKIIDGTLPSTIMEVKSKNLRYETHRPGTYYRLCMLSKGSVCFEGNFEVNPLFWRLDGVDRIPS